GDLSFLVFEILRPANRYKQDIDVTDLQCFRWADSIFNRSKVTEANTLHRPGVRNIYAGGNRKVLRTRLNSSNQDAACAIYPCRHRTAKDDRRVGCKIGIVGRIILMRNQYNIGSHAARLRRTSDELGIERIRQYGDP